MTPGIGAAPASDQLAMAPRRSLSVEACPKICQKQLSESAVRRSRSAPSGSCRRAQRRSLRSGEPRSLSARRRRERSQQPEALVSRRHLQYSYLIAIRINAEYPSFNYKFYSGFYFSGHKLVSLKTSSRGRARGPWSRAMPTTRPIHIPREIK